MSHAVAPQTVTFGERFVVDDVLGRGRSAVVYRALDLHTKTRVALKVLDPLLAHDPVCVARFQREVAIVRTVHHPNIVRVFDVLQERDTWIICMEYVEGLDGKRHLQRFGPLAIPEALTCARQIVSALAACHRQRVLHRDLKPQNILIGAEGTLKLVDFGVAHLATMSALTRTGTIVGTAEYMAPELFTTARPDPRSDIYSFGALLYVLLTGRPPHTAGSLPELMHRQLQREAVTMTAARADVPRWLDAIGRKCLRLDPSDRYQTCEEILQDLDRGERVSPARLDRQDPPGCIHCHTPRIAELPFCAQCGRFGLESFAPGPYSVLLYQCDDTAALAAQIARLCNIAVSTRLRRRMDTLPVVLFENLSEETARALSHELSAQGADVRVTANRLRDFRVPRLLYSLSVLLMLPVWLLAETVTRRLLFTGAAVAVLIGVYRWMSRPLASLPLHERSSTSPLAPLLRELAGAISGLHYRQRKTVLGHATAALVKLRTAPSASVDFDAVGRLVLAGTATAAALERYALYLSSRSLNVIRDRRDAVEAKLAHTRDPAVVEPLLALRAALDAEQTRYLEVQERYARGSLAIFALNAALQRAQTIGSGDPDEAAAELRGLEDELRIWPRGDDETL